MKLLAKLLLCCTVIGAQTPAMLDPNLGVRTVASGFTTPIGLAFIAPSEMLVIEKNTGAVKRVVNGVVQGTVLDLAVNFASERGLLGIAVDPSFLTNQFVYLYWTCRAPAGADPASPSQTVCSGAPETGADTNDILAVPLRGNRIDRFRWNGTELVWDRNLINLRSFQNDGVPIPAGQGDDGQPAAGNHNGGVLRFGMDGMLYAVIGDNGRRGWLQNLLGGPKGDGSPDDQFGGPAPDNAHFTGVILRLNTDGSAPSTNPFFSAGAALGGEIGANIQKVFSYGHRNSFGMAFDPVGGSLWLQENGDDSFDEINRVTAGMNSGWVQLTGPSSRFAEFKAIETSSQFFGLQQRRWPPTNLAATGAEALSRLYMLPGAFYREPEFSWKFAVAPAGIGFQNGPGLGAAYAGDLFVGLSTPQLLGGSLLRFDLALDRNSLAPGDPRLADKVADNLAKNDARESELLLAGTNFGVVTDVQTSPSGSLYLAGLSRGAIYEVFAAPASTCAGNATGSVNIARSGVRLNVATGRFTQSVTVTNTSGSAISGPISLVLDNLSTGVSLYAPAGATSCASPAGAQYALVLAGADNLLSPGETATLTLEFSNPTAQPVAYTPRLLAGKALR